MGQWTITDPRSLRSPVKSCQHRPLKGQRSGEKSGNLTYLQTKIFIETLVLQINVFKTQVWLHWSISRCSTDEWRQITGGHVMNTFSILNNSYCTITHTYWYYNAVQLFDFMCSFKYCVTSLCAEMSYLWLRRVPQDSLQTVVVGSNHRPSD